MYLIKYLSIYLMMVSLYTYNRFFFSVCLYHSCVFKFQGLKDFFSCLFTFFWFVLFCLFFNLIKTLAITKYLLTIFTYKQCMLLTLLTELYSTYKTILIYNVRYATNNTILYLQYKNLQYLLTLRYLH